jgi:hypothetical protein
MIHQIINDHTTMKPQKPNSLLINSYNLNGQTFIYELLLTKEREKKQVMKGLISNDI